jgi:RNA-directed DNA polymerase
MGMERRGQLILFRRGVNQVLGRNPPAKRSHWLGEKSRMSREAPVRFCEGLGVKLPRATRLVILVDAFPRHDWLLQAVNKRLREELAKLHVEINEEKSRIVDLSKGESFGFLGFEFRRVRSRKGVWRPRYTPKLKKRTALLDKLKDIFRCFQSQPIGRVVALINPILRGWVRYFAIGDSSRCFGYIKDWVEKKVRRHLMRARGQRGFGWDRWSRRWLYEHLGLFEGYRVSRPPKALPTG